MVDVLNVLLLSVLLDRVDCVEVELDDDTVLLLLLLSEDCVLVLELLLDELDVLELSSSSCLPIICICSVTSPETAPSRTMCATPSWMSNASV